jgi:hypothetical protein
MSEAIKVMTQTESSSDTAWAEFLEWHYSADKQHIPRYEIKGHHKLSGVIVDANSLLRFGFAVPPTPECKYPEDTKGQFND